MKTKELSNKRKGLLAAILLQLLIMPHVSLHAQVTIGGLTDPTAGALLDLNSNNGTKGGLLLSNVSLVNLYTVPASFPGIDGTNNSIRNDLKGALVYNTNPEWGVGIYLWNGSNWTPVEEDCTSLKQLTLTPFPFALAKTNEPLTFSASSGASDRCAEGEAYKWFWKAEEDGYGQGHEPTPPGTTCSISFSLEKTHHVKVAATSRYADPVLFSEESEEVTVYVTDNGNVPAELLDANYSISGITCYDVNAFGDLTKTYLFNHSNDYQDLEIGNPGGIVESVDLLPANTSGSGNGSVSFTVKFKSDVKKLVSAAGGKVKLKLPVRYKNNALALKVASLDVYVKAINTASCPGAVICGGVHTGPDLAAISNNLSYKSVMSNYGFTRDASKDLCVYYRDASTDATDKAANPTTFYWWGSNDAGPYEPESDQYAVTLCKFGTGVDDADRLNVSGTNAWRLPNVVELGQMAVDKGRDDSPRYDALNLEPGADTRMVNMRYGSYWSSTEQSSANVMRWAYTPVSASITGAWMHNKPFPAWVRCVRTMD
jgi:hypothetical protein